MITAWMLYSTAVAAVLGVSALALENGLRRRRVPLRWLWTVSLLATLALSAGPWLDGYERSSTPDVVLEVDPGVIEASPLSPSAVVAGLDPAPRLARSISALARLDVPLLALWAGTSGAAFYFLAGTHRRLNRRRRLWRGTVVEGVPVLISRDVGPAVVGLMRSTIVLPHWVLRMESEQRRLVVAHEEEHLRAGDARLLGLALVAVALIPWCVPLWWQVRRLRHAVELDCDARVMAQARDAETYCELLIEVGQRASMRGVAFAAFAESSSFLERRIRSMVGPEPRPWRLAVGAGVTVAGLLVVHACNAPIPTMPSIGDSTRGSSGEPVTVEAPSDTGLSASTPAAPADTVAGQADAPGEIDPEPEAAATSAADTGPGSREVRELVRRRHPDIYSAGLAVDQAVWFAVNLDGSIRKSWLGPNIYLNFDDFQPLREFTLPLGSAERSLAEAEHQRLEQRILQENVPGMAVRGMYAAHYYGGAEAGAFTVHFVTEAAGEPMWGGRHSLAEKSVAEAIRAELQR